MLQELGIGLLRLKDDVSSAAAGDLQVAALRTRGHSLCRPLVPSLLASYRDVQELLIERGLGGRPYDGLAMGSTLCTGTRGEDSTASETDQQILARG